MDDAVAQVGHVEQRHPEFAAVSLQGLDLDARLLGHVSAAGIGGDIVVDHGQRGVGAPHLAAGQLQPLESLRTGDFMDQMPVDVDQAGAVILPVDDVALPDLVE
jgi:hypothetical protein